MKVSKIPLNVDFLCLRFPCLNFNIPVGMFKKLHILALIAPCAGLDDDFALQRAGSIIRL